MRQMSGCMETSGFPVDFLIFNPYIQGYVNLVESHKAFPVH